jgi:hypothetical protein
MSRNKVRDFSYCNNKPQENKNQKNCNTMMHHGDNAEEDEGEAFCP